MTLRTKSSTQISESMLLGALLALNGGFLESYTYITRGGVFANAQTGNLVLLAIHAADGDVKGAMYYAIPVSAFIVGIFLTNFIRLKLGRHRRFHWRQLVLLLEIALLAAAASVPIHDYDIVVVFCISFVCALQYGSFKKVKGIGLATTFCTGNLRTATENLFDYTHTGKKRSLRNSLYLFGIIACFIGGAVAGTLLTKTFYEKSVYFCCLMLGIAFLIMFIQNEEKKPKKIA